MFLLYSGYEGEKIHQMTHVLAFFYPPLAVDCKILQIMQIFIIIFFFCEEFLHIYDTILLVSVVHFCTS